MGAPHGPAIERLQRRIVIDPDTGCHNWSGFVSKEGYGRIGTEAGVRMTHRVAYEARKGVVPAGLLLDHLCRNRRCCNPEHLEAVTQQVNALRGEGVAAKNSRKTHCIRGHEFTPENTARHGRNRRGRVCRKCRNARTAQRKALRLKKSERETCA